MANQRQQSSIVKLFCHGGYLQQGQTLRETVHKDVGGELGDQLSEGGHGDALEEGRGLPVIPSLETHHVSYHISQVYSGGHCLPETMP